MSAAVHEWFAARIPEDWHAQGVEVLADQDEILVVVDLPPEEDGRPGAEEGEAGGERGGYAGGDRASSRAGSAGGGRGSSRAGSAGGPTDHATSGGKDHAGGRQELTGIRLFREATRDERMALARAAEQTFGQKVSWGARDRGVVVVFTTTSVPVMTRLRLPERRVLDTLIDAGVARSRSEALAWCVRLVGDNEKEWIVELRTAFEAVEAARAGGPRSRRRPSD